MKETIKLYPHVCTLVFVFMARRGQFLKHISKYGSSLRVKNAWGWGRINNARL